MAGNTAHASIFIPNQPVAAARNGKAFTSCAPDQPWKDSRALTVYDSDCKSVEAHSVGTEKIIRGKMGMNLHISKCCSLKAFVTADMLACYSRKSTGVTVTSVPVSHDSESACTISGPEAETAKWNQVIIHCNIHTCAL